jgi:hypothetical protein
MTEPIDPCQPAADALACPSGDADGDGVPNADDPAPTEPCMPDASALRCGTGDADGDGIDNQTECPALQSCKDSDGDGVPDYQDSDNDGDGNPANGDGSPDYVQANNVGAELDADEDGLTDAQECPDDTCADTDHDGTPDNLDADDDGDGVPTSTEVVDEGKYGTDVDHDGRVNHLDADNDDLRDGKEAGDANGNGVPDYLEKRFIDDDGCSVASSRNPVGGWWLFAIFAWMLTWRRSRGATAPSCSAPGQ